jgi:3-oxoacyl-[acyl-carrier protein] reductase
VDLGIAGRTALVTASSKGLGRASALALAAEGVKVGICSRGEAALRETEQLIKDQGGEVLALVADVTEPSEPLRLVEAVASRFGGLDILVANAGGPPAGRSLEVTDDQVAAAVNANAVTSIRLVRRATLWMRRGGWGRICLITSFSIKDPLPGLALSNLARTGLWAWARTAAADLFPDGITLNTACPGLHATERAMQLAGGTGTGERAGLPRMGDPADFGRIVAFLCSEPAGFMSGAAVTVDGAAAHGLL